MRSFNDKKRSSWQCVCPEAAPLPFHQEQSNAGSTARPWLQLLPAAEEESETVAFVVLAITSVGTSRANHSLQCDQSKPKCSRCKRLDIPCVDCGVRRFVFKNSFSSSNNNGTDDKHRYVHDEPSLVNNGARENRRLRIYRMPPNAVSSLTSFVIKKLQVDDLRYNIKWAYGPFVDEIPTRLGQSSALDAACRSLFMLSGSSGGYHDPQGSVSLPGYSQALRAIRLAIADRAQAYSLNTLCAIYFVWLLQVWRLVHNGLFVCLLVPALLSSDCSRSASGMSRARVRSMLSLFRIS